MKKRSQERAESPDGSRRNSWSKGKPSRALVVLGSALSLVSAALVVTWGVSRIPAATVTPNKEISAAQAAVLDALQKNSGRPQEPAALQEAAANLFVILRPELAQRDLRNDPGFVQAQAAAAASFFNPGALHAKRMQDPTYRENYNAALQSLQRQAREAELAIPPSATDARQIEALRNDPKWRQEREESLRAAMQVKPNP